MLSKCQNCGFLTVLEQHHTLWLCKHCIRSRQSMEEALINKMPSPLAAKIAEMRRGSALQVEVAGSKGGSYTVRLSFDNIWTCTCKAFEFGNGKLCKHIHHVQELQEWKDSLYGDGTQSSGPDKPDLEER